MKRESSDKTRFCVSHDGLSNGLETFCLPCFMFKNKTKNMFLNRRGSNILEPRLQYNGARAPIYWSPSNIFENPFLSWIKPIQMDWVLLNLICVIAKEYFRPTSLFCKTNIWSAPIYWSPGSIILEPRLQYIGAPPVQKHVFCFIFEHETRQTKGF